jgi:hypothetical protein
MKATTRISSSSGFLTPHVNALVKLGPTRRQCMAAGQMKDDTLAGWNGSFDKLAESVETH